jgi:tetratricopeptide (TPR) repeat protein
VHDRQRIPNQVLRRIREAERRESRQEFAESLAKVAERLHERVSPSERYVARLEDGEVIYPSAPYRHVLEELCGRPISELGFARRYSGGQAITSRAAVPANRSRAALSDITAVSEWPTWFGTRTAHLMSLVHNWDDAGYQFDSLQAILHQEVLMFDAMAPDDLPDGAIHALARRQALITLAALPLSLGTSKSISSPAATEDFLSRSAASLTACWHLLRGTDLEAVDQIVSAYIVGLDGIAEQHSRYQPAAARLASQAHRISGIVALHRDKLNLREIHCRQALRFATIASDPSSQASALISLASTYFYRSESTQAAVVYERAFGLQSDISPLQLSRVHAELSVVYAQLGRASEAIRAAGLAEELYPDQPEQDQSFLYAEFTPASLTLEQGLAYVALARQRADQGYAQRAADIFMRLNTTPAAVPDRIRFEIINQQAATAVYLNDLEAFEAYMTSALDGVALLGSKQRQKEAGQAWVLATEKWPGEPRMRALTENKLLIVDGGREDDS